MMLYAFPGRLFDNASDFRVFFGVFVQLKCSAEIRINLVVGSL